jgi:pectate lyase
MKIMHTILGVAALVLATSASAANRPTGYTTVCTEGKTCAIAGTANLAFGRAGTFFYKVITGTFVCSEATFGGRVAGGVNECSAPNGTSSSSASSTSSTSTSSSSVSSIGGTGACKAGATISGVADCGGQTVGTSCDGQSESQQPVFTLNDGATIKNLHIAASGGADGIHCLGSCTLQNVVWDDVCEDAATMLGGAGKVMTVTGGSAANAADKVFQHNGKGSTVSISNFQTIGTIGKLYRSCGDCTANGGPRMVTVNNVIIEKSGDLIGVNKNYGDKATIRNLKVKGYVPGGPKICMTFNGVTDHNGSSSKLGEEWNTATCDISRTDVTVYLDPRI